MRNFEYRRLTRWIWPAGVAAGLIAFAGVATTGPMAYQGDLPLRLTAFAVNRDAATGSQTGMVDITIERWSSPEETARFRDILVESGSDALLQWVEDIEPRAGYIQVDDSLGWDIHYATFEEQASGGLRIVFVTNRPMSFWEAAGQPRSAQYEFIFGAMRLNEEGEGQGKLSSATKIQYERPTKRIVMENYSIEPVRLQQIRMVDR